MDLAEARHKLKKKIAKKFKIKKTYSSHKDLIKDINNFDGVVIVTRERNDRSFDKFLKLSKPILTEKPMAGNSIQSVKLSTKRNKSLRCISWI